MPGLGRVRVLGAVSRSPGRRLHAAGAGQRPRHGCARGQCITTGDAVKNRTAVFTVLGKAVVFESGTRTGPLPSDPPPPSPSPSPIPSPSPGAPPAPVDGPEAWVDPAADGPAEVGGAGGVGRSGWAHLLWAAALAGAGC